MEFKLTEDQSYDLLTHFGNYSNIISLVHEQAYDILERYYTTYKQNHKGLFKPMKKDRFFDRICKQGTNLHTSTTVVAGKKYVYSYNRAELNPKFLLQLKVSPETIANQIVHAALESPYILGKKVLEVQEMHDLLLEYGSVPFTVDTEILKLYETVKESNLKLLELLEVIGIKYEL